MKEDNVDFNLMFELIKDTNNRVRKTEEEMRDLKSINISIREDINGVRSDLLRHEKAFAVLEADMDRIKNRLDLVDS